MACANCGSTQGPFIQVAPGKKVCSPVELDEKGRLKGRVKECVARRDAQDAKKYGPVV